MAAGGRAIVSPVPSTADALDPAADFFASYARLVSAATASDIDAAFYWLEATARAAQRVLEGASAPDAVELARRRLAGLSKAHVFSFMQRPPLHLIDEGCIAAQVIAKHVEGDAK